MPHALAEHPLPGLDAVRLQRLEVGGIDSLEALVDAGPERLAELTGFDLKTSEALVRVAEGALARVLPGVIEFVPRDAEAPTRRLARGLEAAREVERWLSVVRAARDHIGREPAKVRWSGEHATARRQLKKLQRCLTDLQRGILSDGLSPRGDRHLREQLQGLASLQQALGEAPRGRVYKAVARGAKRTRHALARRPAR